MMALASWRCPGFGELFVDQIRAGHVDRWKELMGGLIQSGQYSPNTVNSWLGVLRVVLKAAAREFARERVATDGTTNFDASAHVTYSEEDPNALTPEQVPVFLAALKEDFPQHYAMAFLGLATGLRPSSLRPLRRKGDQVDVLLDAGKLLVRRSQTMVGSSSSICRSAFCRAWKLFLARSKSTRRALPLAR